MKGACRFFVPLFSPIHSSPLLLITPRIEVAYQADINAGFKKRKRSN